MLQKKLFYLLMTILLVLLIGCSQTVSNKKITIAFQDENISGEYTGTLESGRAFGDGIFVASSGDTPWTYSGDWQKSEMVGNGTFTDLPMSITFEGIVYEGKYTGDCENGVVSGNGVFTAIKDEQEFIYKGGFSSGTMTGTGELITPALSLNFLDIVRTGTYSGDIVDFRPEGLGEFNAVNGDGQAYTISGEWQDGLQHGQSMRMMKGDVFPVERGKFTYGVYTPTILEIIKNDTDWSNMPINISQETIKFVNEHSALFPAQYAGELSDYLNTEIEYKHLSKNIADYHETIVELQQFYVLQVHEINNSASGGMNITILQLIKDGDFFYVYLPGKYNVFNKDVVTVYGLPISMSSFDNVGGGTTLPCVMLGSFIQ